MRLRRHSLHCYRLRYERPVRWSDIVEEAAPFVLLRLESDTGAIGVAEITVKPTWCGVTARSLITAIEEIFIPLIAGVDLDDPTTVRTALDRVPENQAAKTLIDNACWDLHAAHGGTALWRQWNGASRVELSWALTRQAPPLMAAEATNMVARYGFHTLKVKGGQGIDVDLAGLRVTTSGSMLTLTAPIRHSRRQTTSRPFRGGGGDGRGSVPVQPKRVVSQTAAVQSGARAGGL